MADPKECRARAEGAGGRGLALVCALAVLPLAAAVLLLWQGVGSVPASGAGAAREGAAGGSGDGTTGWRLLLALAVIIAAARAAGALFSRFLGQPRVIGEMVAGIVLGPSVLGMLTPGLYRALFPTALLPHVEAVSQIGLALFMFLVGLEFGAARHEGQGRTGMAVGLVGVALPCALGVGLGCAMYRTLAPHGVEFVPFALFIGVAMSVTAFPVLARLLMERGLLQSRAGSLAVLGAAVADLVCWLLLALVVTLLRSSSPLGVVRTLALTALFLAGMLFLVRPLLRKLLGRPERWLPDGGLLALVLVGVLLSAVATERIGVHLIFGAFLFGAVCPAGVPALDAAQDRMQEFTTSVLLPPFFAYVGLKTDLGLLTDDAGLWLWAGATLFVAVAGKIVGCATAAALMGVERADALRVGTLMNCRGLTELVILTIGRELGVLSPALFTVLVLVALAATVMTAPLLDVLDRRTADVTLLSIHH
ncbi:cation:proton antiporter [Streptomyces sp. NPDC087300]|uniref:cation:proton antiporter domain-containing protein n=1 Tax=Streptomyces sp. NPDC087300 TaxID=3365780 RepID=UPI00380202A8